MKDLPFGRDIYCFDTSALIDMKRHYPFHIFIKLWEQMSSFAKAGTVFAPKEVFDELVRGDDELVAWAKKNRTMFIDLDTEQINLAMTIQRVFPDLVDTDRETPQADPFIVALAKQKAGIVVTNEKRFDRKKRTRIPDVCEHYSIKCMNSIEFITRQGWKF